MALAIFPSHPEMILNAENNTKSQIAALLTSVPTIFKWWSINTVVVLPDAVMMETPNVKVSRAQRQGAARRSRRSCAPRRLVAGCRSRPVC